MRIGHSTDIHILEKGRDLILGGVKIPYDLGLVGHSDADCLLHVVAESIIGALGLGDLGTHFPDTKENFKNISSSKLVKHVVKLMSDRNYVISNIDTLIFAEKPNLQKYKETMKENIAFLLNTSIDNVNVKATTYEKKGFIGNGEAIMCEAVVLIKKGD